MEELIKEICNRSKLSEGDETFLRQHLRTLHYPKGSVVIPVGHTDDSVYFLQRGVWRAHIEREEQQLTLWFAVPGETVFSSWGVICELPSRYTISSSSDSIAIAMDKKTLQYLTHSSPQFMEFLQELYLKMVLTADNQLVDISCPRAAERYLAFMKKMPELFKVVPLKEIAAYIGVTQQSLSRIRAGLKGK